MKILLISALPAASRTLGASKASLDAALALEAAGATCDVFPKEPIEAANYFEEVKAFIDTIGDQYDVIEVPETFPVGTLKRTPGTLLVVRSVLLVSHLRYLKIEEFPTTLKSKIFQYFFGSRIEAKKEQQKKADIEQIEANLAAGDLVIVGNSKDKKILLENGFSEEEIHVQPYGLPESRLDDLGKTDHSQPHPPTLVFLGTFDFRKGCIDIVRLFEKTVAKFPNAKLKLLGTKGLIPTKQRTLSLFPKQLRKNIEVVLRFEEDNLPHLLTNSDVGIFPSYWEGFGIAVVEMLAAGIPVFAYNAPGPCDILEPEFLIDPGDLESLEDKVLSLLEPKAVNESIRRRSKEQASRFIWKRIGISTFEAYQKKLSALRKD